MKILMIKSAKAKYKKLLFKIPLMKQECKKKQIPIIEKRIPKLLSEWITLLSFINLFRISVIITQNLKIKFVKT